MKQISLLLLFSSMFLIGCGSPTDTTVIEPADLTEEQQDAMYDGEDE